MRVLNIGSMNLDYVYQVDHIVQPGETEATGERNVHLGGKGMNQTVWDDIQGKRHSLVNTSIIVVMGISSDGRY